MAGHEQLGNEMPPAEQDQKSEDELVKAKSERQRAASVRRTKTDPRANSKKEDRVLVKVQDALAAAQLELEQERQKRIQAEKALTEAEEALAAVHSKLAKEHQMRVKAEKNKIDAESNLEEPINNMLIENTEIPPKPTGRDGTERRLSFIVRLMLDDRGEAKRIEIEDTQSRKKESFPTLDGERLMLFIKSCIHPVPPVPQSPVSTQIVIATSEHRRGPSSLTISDVRVFRMGMPETMGLTVNPAEDIFIETRFQLPAPDESSLPTNETLCEVLVYAKKLGKSESKLLTTYRGSFLQDVWENVVQMQVPSLSSGAYRLVTVVTLLKPIKAASYYEGPTVQVN